MNEEGFVSDAYCGLYCPACPNYMNTEKNPDAPRVTETCRGCKSDVLCLSWCDHCTLKACAQTHGVDFCHECGEYPCRNLNDFKNDPRYPYHVEVYDSLGIIKSQGKDAWLAGMAKRWSCPACGTAFNWWTQTCATCGKPVKGYAKPD
jgi:hypothetical protein